MSAEPEGMPPEYRDRLVACVDMLGRAGAQATQIRFADDEQPTVWFLVAQFPDGRWDAAAGQDPLHAAGRLLEQLVDGGSCKHCGRPTGFSLDTDSMPMDELVCWYQYDPSTKAIVKGCVK